MQVNTKLEKIEDNIHIDNDEIEKNSYSNYMYKKLLRARKKGIQHGIEIPKLKYELEKPKKDRVIFKVIACIMLALSIAVLIGLIAFYAVSGVFSFFVGFIKSSSGTFSAEALERSLGLSGFLAIGVVGLYVLFALLIILPIIIEWTLIAFTIKNFSLTRISRQEMAKGFEVRNYIIGLIIASFSCLAIILILLFNNMMSGSLSILIVIICSAIASICLTLIVLLVKERKKEKLWFNNLPIENQTDFKQQNDAIFHLKQTLKMSRNNHNIFGGNW